MFESIHKIQNIFFSIVQHKKDQTDFSKRKTTEQSSHLEENISNYGKVFFCYLQIVKSTGTRDRSRLPGICQGNVSSAHTDHGWRKGETPRALETIGNRGQRKIREDWTLGGSTRVSGCHYWPQSVWLLVSIPVFGPKK